VIAPLYFYQQGDKTASKHPVEYIEKHWGEKVKGMSIEQLRFEATTMLDHRNECSKLVTEDLSNYTSTMASILDVKRTVLGKDDPVYDRNGWIQSLVENHSHLQLQKWMFAWMFVCSNYKKFVSTFKHPDENFEDKFLALHGLQYDPQSLLTMKKNSKTCVRLFYNLRARSWKEWMLAEIKDKLHLTISITAPKDMRHGDKNYRREPNTFFLGRLVDGKLVWKEVRLMHCKVWVF